MIICFKCNQYLFIVELIAVNLIKIVFDIQ